jgi:undecaprenyl-diphosphatase
MITYFQAIVLGVIQGVTELFPISSLGHSVIVPSLLGWNINQSSNFFVIFLVGVHLATALVLLGFFFADWMLIVKGVFRSIFNMRIERGDIYAKIGWLIIIGTIPAGLVGLVFQKKLQALFALPEYAAAFLILNGLILLGAESLRKRKVQIADEGNSVDEGISKVSSFQAFKIGCAQCLALIPGLSRTGSTLGGGLLVGLDHEQAARFSFLLATPLIFSAAVLKLPGLLHIPGSGAKEIVLIGAISAAVGAYASVKFLTSYFKANRLTPFAIYCVLAGLISFFILIR